MNFSRNKIWFLPLLVVLLYPLWGDFVKKFLTVNVDEMNFVKQLVSKENPQFRMEGFTLYQTGNGKLELKLLADAVLSGDPGTSEYRLKGVHCTLYGEDEQETIITGGQALYVTEQQLITIVDEVVVNGNNGEFLLETDALRYFTFYKVAKTATPVVLKNDKGIIRGDSMMYNMKTGGFRITGNVVCEL